MKQNNSIDKLCDFSENFGPSCLPTFQCLVPWRTDRRANPCGERPYSKAFGQNWSAFLAQAQANRDQAQANRDQAQANREQAFANHDTAKTLMLAIREIPIHVPSNPTSFIAGTMTPRMW